MQKLDSECLRIRAFADASFATNHDHTSQLGHIVMLCDKQDNACIIHYASYKSSRVARSVLGAETYAFTDTCDFAYCAKRDLESIVDRTVPLEIYADSISLFDVITECLQTQERRLMIDLQAARDAYKSHEIWEVGFIRGSNKPADGMTKPFKCTLLHDLLRTGKANFTIDQWVIRSIYTTVRSDIASSAANAKNDSTRHYPTYHEQVAGNQTQNNCKIESTAY